MTPQDKLKAAIKNTVMKSTEEEEDNNFEEVLTLSENDEHETFQSFPKAIVLVAKAEEEDNNKNYEDALRLYETGVENFLQAIKDEVQGEKTKERIRAIIKKYGERAEEIREYLETFKSQELDDHTHSVLETAICMVTKAVEEDTNRNYVEAVRLYEEGIDHFAYAMDYEAEGDRAKASIQYKMKEYDERAEKLRKYLEKKRQELDNDSECDSESEDEMFNKKSNQCCWIC